MDQPAQKEEEDYDQSSPPSDKLEHALSSQILVEFVATVYTASIKIDCFWSLTTDKRPEKKSEALRPQERSKSKRSGFNTAIVLNDSLVLTANHVWGFPEGMGLSLPAYF